MPYPTRTPTTTRPTASTSAEPSAATRSPSSAAARSSRPGEPRAADRVLACRVRRLAESWARSQYELVVAAAEFADGGVWALDGAPTAAHWLAAVADVETCTTREWIRIGRLLRSLPTVADALAAGEISYSKVRVLTRIAEPHNENELLEIARATPAGCLARALAAWMTRTSDPGELEDHQHTQRSITWRSEPGGMTTFTLRLPPLLAGLLIAALTTIVMRTKSPKRGSGQPWPSLAQQHADALETLLTTGPSELATEVVIHIRGDGNTFDDGTPIPNSVVERIAPKAFLRALIHDANAKPINASSRQRHPTTRQKRVVDERDRGCVDCGTTRLLEFDHNPSYATSKRTVIDELQTRCAPCHHRRHTAATVDPSTTAS